jgi:hypothetical protein
MTAFDFSLPAGVFFGSGKLRRPGALLEQSYRTVQDTRLPSSEGHRSIAGCQCNLLDNVAISDVDPNPKDVDIDRQGNENTMARRAIAVDGGEDCFVLLKIGGLSRFKFS